MGVGEREAIRILSSILGGEPAIPGVELGIGDDCAVLGSSRGRLVLTNDACLEGVHYRRTWLSLADVAHKALGAAASDVAAMGAKIRGVVCHLTLPATLTRSELAEFARGQRAFARKHACSVVGGNIAAGAGFDVVTTVLGELPPGRKPLLRSGARLGDEVWLIGAAGLAHLGLRAWLSKADPAEASLRGPRRAFARPIPRLLEGERLSESANAALDVSDGLVRDGGHLAEASGVRLVFDEGQLLSTWSKAAFRAATFLGEEPLAAILYGGEDYGILATGPARKRPDFARVVGVVERGRGVWLRSPSATKPLVGGFEHGASG